MENATKAIIIAASIIITIAIVTTGFFVFRAGNDAAKASIEKFNDLTNELSDSDYTMFDGVIVSGSQVANAVKKFSKDPVGVSVKTLGGSSHIWYTYQATMSGDTVTALSASASNMSNMYDEMNTSAYVNPNGNFIGTIYRDRNGRIAAVSFVQQP